MSKKKLLILQVFTIIVLVCTSVYATVNATISLSADKTSVYRGDTVTVTLSLKDVASTDKVTSIEGYVNYDKDVIEDITYASIVKDSNNTVTIGNEVLTVEDVTNGTVTPSTAYIGFNSDPASNNDNKFVIDFKDGISSNAELFKINFKVKTNATYGEIRNAITYKAFVITLGSDEISQEITGNVDLTINKVNTDPDDPPVNPTKTLTGIAITTAPNKTKYVEGETFDKTGMVVTAGYSDGSKSAVTSYSYAPTAALTTSDKTITVTYTEGGVTKTANQSITVTEKQQDTGKTLSSISITKGPNKTKYESGETFDKSGMVVKAKYTDGTEKEVSNYTTSPTSILTTSDKTITVSYTEGGVTKTASQGITVTAKASGTGSNTNRNTNTNNTNTKSNTNSLDNTVAGNKLPATGAKLIIAPVIILAVLAYASYKKYSNYKGI